MAREHRNPNSDGERQVKNEVGTDRPAKENKDTHHEGHRSDHSIVDVGRRDFLKTATAAGIGIGSLGFSLSNKAMAATRIAEESNEGSLQVNDTFTLLDNQWGNPNAQQAVWVNDDGSYGWDFDSTGSGDGINYPEVFVGSRPWAWPPNTQPSMFPIQRGNVDEYVLDVQADYSISGGEWDWAHEWWLMEEKPSEQSGTHKYEIMLLLDWGGGHSHGTPVYTDLWTDEYGNTIDLWALYNSGGTSATFYIFRVQGGHDGGKVDMKPLIDWLTTHEGIREDLWISGSELGNEYWPGATGTNTINKFDVTVNGNTYVSRETNQDGSAPSAPSSLSVTTKDSESVSLDWDAATDSGGSGLDHYNVYVDGSKSQQVPANETSAIVSGLSSRTSYDFSVTAVDGAGNESGPSNTVSVRTESAPTIESFVLSPSSAIGDDRMLAITWEVSSSEDDLDVVEVVVDDGDFNLDFSVTDVSGGRASGWELFQFPLNTQLNVDLRVTDTEENVTTKTKTVTL